MRMTGLTSAGGVAFETERAGDGAVAGHRELDGRFFGSFRSGIGELPVPGDVAFGRILGPFRLADFETAAIDKYQFDFRFFLEEVAIGYDQVGDFAFFDGAEAVGNSVNFSRR